MVEKDNLVNGKKYLCLYCYVYTDTVDVSLAVRTFVLMDKSGWITLSALEQKQVSQIVHTEPGAVTTVDMKKTSESRATSHLQEVCT